MDQDIRVAIVLPAYNAASDLRNTLRNVAAGMESFPHIDFQVHAVDDGSPDNGETWDAIQAYGSHFLEDRLLAHRNESNLGLVQTLKNTYTHVLASSFAPSHVLKTDTDRDFDQEVVLNQLLPHTASDTELVVGVLTREITVDENAYEVVRQNDIGHVMAREFGLINVNPAYCGSQLHRNESLKQLLAENCIVEHEERWGLDTHLLFVAMHRQRDVEVERIVEEEYAAVRRDPEKVKTQFDVYTQKLAALIGTEPEQLSGMYGLPPFDVRAAS